MNQVKNLDIKLRRLEMRDNEKISILLNNRKILDNLRDCIPYPYKIEDAEFFIESKEKESPHQTFGIEVDEELCGVIGLAKQSDVYKRTAEIVYWIGEKYWGKGIATKSIELITKYGFLELNLERIYAGVFEFNNSSMKVLEKNGYRKEGVFKNAIVKNGKIYNEHRYAKLKNE